MTTTTMRASVTAASAGASVGDPAVVLVDGSDTPITANGLGEYTPTPGDRLLVQKVGSRVEVLQFLYRGTVPQATVADGSITVAKLADDAVTGPKIADGAVTDDSVALATISPLKTQVGGVPGSFNNLIHDWRFKNDAFRIPRIAGLGPTMAWETIVDTSPAGVANGTIVVGDPIPAVFTAGPKITLGTAHTIYGEDAITLHVNSTLTNGDILLSATYDLPTGQHTGGTTWASAFPLEWNSDSNTNANANGLMAAQSVLYALDASDTVVKFVQNVPGGADWAFLRETLSIDDPGITVTKFRFEFVWIGPDLAADPAGDFSMNSPGFSLWDVGGPDLLPGTPYLAIGPGDSDVTMYLLKDLPVQPGETYELSVRYNPYSQTEEGVIGFQGGILVQEHNADGSDGNEWAIGGGEPDSSSPVNSGWVSVFTPFTISDNAATVDVFFISSHPCTGLARFIQPRFQLSGWRATGTFGEGGGTGALMSDSEITLYRTDGFPEFSFQTGTGLLASGYVVYHPRSDDADPNSGVVVWPGGEETNWFDNPAREHLVGVSFNPYTAYRSAYSPRGASVDSSTGYDDAGMIVAADRGTAPGANTVGFVGIEPGTWPTPGTTAVRTGFEFDSAAGTITPVGDLVVPANPSDTAWAALPYLAGWHDYGVSYQGCQYRRVNGMVELRGLAASANASAYIGSLPSGFRPAHNLIIPTQAENSPSTNTFTTLTVQTDGGLLLGFLPASGYWATLENIRFPADGS